MNKPELVAALNELSGKLGRELRTEGSNVELQARLDEGLAELRLLEEEDSEGGEVETFSGDAVDSEPAAPSPEENAQEGAGVRDDLRQVRLLTTLHIKHYQPAGSPELYRIRRGIVSKDAVVIVSAKDAEQFSRHGYATYE